MKSKRPSTTDDMPAEYDLDYSKAVRGKYYRRITTESATIVVLEPDVARAFPGSAAVNAALRGLMHGSRTTPRPVRRPQRTATSARG